MSHYDTLNSSINTNYANIASEYTNLSNKMTNEHNSIKTLLQNTGVVKSINRGLYSGASIYGQTRTKAASFSVTASKSVLILNIGDLTAGSRSYSENMVSIFESIEINNDGLYFTLNISSNSCIPVYFYWQVVEFY